MRSFAALAIFACSVWPIAADSASSTVSGTSVSSTSGTSCAAQAVLDACLGLEQPQLASCGTDDWDCMCTQSNNVLTCYNDCPSDPNAFSAQQVKISYCNAASVYGTAAAAVATSTSSPSRSSAISQSAAAESSAASETSSSSPMEFSGTSSSSAATPSNSSAKSAKGAAAELGIEASSLLVAMILGIGAAL